MYNSKTIRDLMYINCNKHDVGGVTKLKLSRRLEQFSIECRKTENNVITLANHKGRRKSSEPIKTWSNYM